MTKLVRTKTGPHPWVTEAEESGGGGGSIPNPITDPLNIALTDPGNVPITAQAAAGSAVDLLDFLDENSVGVLFVGPSGEMIIAPAGTTMVTVHDGAIGFFSASPVAQPVVPLTTPGVQDVIDALVALGLVAQHD
jgi:hypothetical protein